MRLFTFLADLKGVRTELRRIADALDRAIPHDPEPVELKPEEAVSYVDEEKLAERELAEEAHALEQWLSEHPEAREEIEGTDMGDALMSEHARTRQQK